MTVVIAMPEEIELVDDKSNYIITGIGALNIFKALKDVDRNEPLFNVGYAGSNCIPVGTRVKVGKVKAYHPNIDFKEPEYDLGGDTPCFTSSDFVLSTEKKEPCVFDMELAYIMAMGFKNVKAEKIVSDCLDIKQFEEKVGREYGK